MVLTEEERVHPAEAALHTRVAPWALLRVAALPYSLLQRASPWQSWQMAQAILDAEDALSQLSGPVVDALHALVAQLTDASHRRVVLQLKRSAHGGEPAAASAIAVLEALAPRCADAEPVLRWLRAQRDLARHRASLGATLTAETEERTRGALRASLAVPAFARSLRQSVPRLMAALDRADAEVWNTGSSRSSKSERTLFNYMARAAAKTSPLGSFMLSTWLPIGPPLAPSTLVVEPDWRLDVQLNRGVVHRIARAATRRADLLQGLRLVPNRSLLRTPDGRLRGLASTHVELLGRPWRQDRVAVFRLPAPALAVLEQLHQPVTQEALTEAFSQAGLAPADVAPLLRQLLANGLVHPEAASHVHETDALGGLLSQLERCGAGNSEVAAELAGISDELDRLRQPGQAMSGTDASPCLDERVRRAEAAAGLRFAQPFQSAMSESAWFIRRSGHLAGELPLLLDELGTALSSHVEVSAEYGRIVELFVDRHGVGGTCDDTLAFLCGIHGDFLASTSPPAAAAMRWPQGASLGITAFVQPLVGHVRGMDTGTSLVANLLYERIGWQACRHLGAANDAGLRDRVSQWVADCAEDAEPVEITASADCNGLQAHPAVTARVFGWPGEGTERLPPAAVVDLRRVRLRHDAERNRLVLTDQTGRRLQPVYLGAVMPMMTWGPAYLLIRLAEPLALARPHHLLQPADGGADVQRVDRVTEGRIVILRTSWHVRAATLAGLLSQPDPARRLEQMARFLRRHGMDRVTYVNAVVTAATVESQRLNLDRLRKPVWCDAANPVCLDLLRRLAGQCDWLVFREALPGEGQHWLEIGGKRHVSELQVELQLRWHCPSAVKPLDAGLTLSSLSERT